MTFYHHTSYEKADQIVRKGFASSLDTQGSVYASNRHGGHAAGYGEGVVAFDAHERHAALDDEFDDGETHYTIPLKHIRNVRRVGAKAEQELPRADTLIVRRLREDAGALPRA